MLNGITWQADADRLTEPQSVWVQATSRCGSEPAPRSDSGSGHAVLDRRGGSLDADDGPRPTRVAVEKRAKLSGGISVRQLHTFGRIGGHDRAAIEEFAHPTRPGRRSEAVHHGRIIAPQATARAKGDRRLRIVPRREAALCLRWALVPTDPRYAGQMDWKGLGELNRLAHGRSPRLARS